MVAGMACFLANDALVKTVSADLNTGQIVLLRGAGACVWLLAMCVASGALRQWTRLFDAAVLQRAGIDGVATLFYLSALVHLPLANVTAINLSAPLMLTALAVLFLGESVGWRRWSAVAVGFVGVLLIVQPKAQGFNWFALVALGGTALHAVRDLLTRRIAAGIPSLLITLSTAVAVTIMGAGFAALEPWRPLEWRAIGLLAATSVLLAAGYYLMVACVRLGELSVVAPFRYTALLWALILGYALWGDLPDAIASIGIVLLIGSGLYVLHRERLKRASLSAD